MMLLFKVAVCYVVSRCGVVAMVKKGWKTYQVLCASFRRAGRGRRDD